jgi:hypothetical protein
VRAAAWARLVAFCLFSLTAACSPAPPDLVLLNGKVFTGDPNQPWAEALAIRGDRIVAVGPTADIARLVGPSSRSRDVGGRTVVPGFNDAHVLDPGGEARAVAAFGRAAVGEGITSMQWFAGTRTVADVARVLLDADLPLRIRVFRMPRTAPDGEAIDSRPHLPPQPSFLLDIRGMGFVLGAEDEARIRQAVGWGYGTEDLLAVEPRDDRALAAYVKAVAETGTAEVWRKKRPRLEHPGPAVLALVEDVAGRGMTVVQRPNGTVPLASLVQHGVTLALGSGSGSQPMKVLAWATAPEHGPEALTMAQAVSALTRGSATAQLADREKGHLTVGALGDVAVLSVDPFSASPHELARGRSVLTIIGGRVVHDVP